MPVNVLILLQNKICRSICVMFHSYVILCTVLRVRSRSQRKKAPAARLQKEKGVVVYGARHDTVIATCCNSDTFPCLPFAKGPWQNAI